MAIYFARPAAFFKHQRKLPQLPMLVRKQLVGAQHFNANTSNQTRRASTE